MGILWTVYPITEEMKEYLDSEEVEYPDCPSNFPTDEEVHLALNRLKKVKVRSSTADPDKGWGALIESETHPEDSWANLQVDILESDPSLRSIWFEKGHEELIIGFLKKLSRTCGPQVLLADCGGAPQVINA